MNLRAIVDGGLHARWLTRDRVVASGWLLALVQATFLILVALWQHGVITAGVAKTSSDFLSFFAAGKLALAGTPALAYDQAAHFLVEKQFAVDGAPYQFFFYPPVFMLVCGPLALLPYFAAFYVFEIGTLALFLISVRTIVREPGWLWPGPILAFPAIFWTFGLGQNAFLTAALFAGFTLFVDRRPGLAGLLLGLLCYKPHFGLLAPVALILGGHWRAFFSAGATVAAIGALSLAFFGLESWQAWWHAFSGSDAIYATGRIDFAGMVTPAGAARLLGFDATSAYLAQAVIAGAAMLIVAVIWRSSPNPSLRAAALLTATLLVVPLALLYDQLLLLVAIAWLVREGRASGFLPWEKTALLAIYLASILEYPLSSALHWPMGPAISLVLMVLAVRRWAFAGQGLTIGASPDMPKTAKA